MTTNLERAALVSRNVELQAVSLISARLDSDVDPLDVPDEMEVGHRYRATTQILPTNPHSLRVIVELGFSATRTSAEMSSSSVVDLECEYLLVYALHNATQYPGDALQHFAELNGAYNVWPYWREMVQTVCGRVGVGAITVPVFRPPVRELSPNEREQLGFLDAEPAEVPNGAE